MVRKMFAIGALLALSGSCAFAGPHADPRMVTVGSRSIPVANVAKDHEENPGVRYALTGEDRVVRDTIEHRISLGGSRHLPVVHRAD
jgi:hypothetical protein